MRVEDLSRNAISKIELKRYGLTRVLESSVEIAGPMVLFMNSMIRKTAAGYINMNEEFKDYLENS